MAKKQDKGLALGEGVVAFIREEHVHETPGGILACADCIAALSSGETAAPDEPAEGGQGGQ